MRLASQLSKIMFSTAIASLTLLRYLVENTKVPRAVALSLIVRGTVVAVERILLSPLDASISRAYTSMHLSLERRSLRIFLSNAHPKPIQGGPACRPFSAPLRPGARPSRARAPPLARSAWGASPCVRHSQNSIPIFSTRFPFLRAPCLPRGCWRGEKMHFLSSGQTPPVHPCAVHGATRDSS
jgi:hypothetical protein